MTSRGTRQRSSWINVNDDGTTAVRLNSARFQTTIYSTSCVSCSPPTCSSALRAVICSGYCSVISRFRLFFSPFFLSFASRKRTSRVSDQSCWQLKCIEPPMETPRNWYTYLTKDHPRVEGLCRRIVNNVPSSKSVVHLHSASTSRSPVVSNLPDAFQGSSLELIA